MPLLFCAFASAQTIDKWNSVRSKNFSIIGNAPLPQMRSASERLEQFRWAFSRVYPLVKLDNGKATEIVIFRDAATYYDFLPRRPDGSADVGVAGYFQAGEDTNYITFAISQQQPDPYSTAVHEYVHSVLDANFERAQLPPWLSEGLAEYFETLRVDGKKVIVGGSQAEHIHLLRRTGTIPLAEFLSLNASEIKTITPDRRRVYYAQAWAIVNILMRQNGAAIDRIATQKVEANVELEAALKKLINTGPEKPVSFGMGDSTTVPGAIETSDITAAVVLARLGDLLLHTGDLTRSESFLRRALVADTNEPLANASLGLLLLKQEKTAESRPFLEKGVVAGSTNYLVLTGFAFSMLEPLAKTGAEIPDKTANEIRVLLDRSALIAPNYPESYRLMALLNYLRDENLDEALSVLQKALAIKRDDPDAQLLTARILLRREKIDSAREAAERVANGTANAKQKSEASDIIKAAFEYKQAQTAARPVRMDVVLGERQTLVILKRSWLTDSDVAQIDRERLNNNFNRIILRAASGESQIVGRIEHVDCEGEKITYRVRSKDGTIALLSGTDFSSLRMTVAREGDSTFQIGCDASLAKELAVLNYQPTRAPANGTSLGQLTAVSFVPEDFRLKTVAEMNAARPIAIDDDTGRRSGPSAEINPEMIHRSISQSLRRLQKGEQRISGTIGKIDCASGSVVFTIFAADRSYKLVQSTNGRPDIGWFTVSSSQLPLACGSGPIGATTLISFILAEKRDGVDGVIKAIEFVPDDFVP